MTGKPIVTKNKITNFGLVKAVYPPNLKQPQHLHESPSLSFVMAGGFTESFERKNRMYQPLTLIVHSAQKSHSVEFYNQPVHILNIQMDSVFLSRFSSHSKILESSTSCRSENIAWLGNRLSREFSRCDELSGLAIEGIVIELLVEVSRQISGKAEPKSSPWLNQAKDFLHDNFSEAVGLEEVAKVVGIHPVHLARVFRRQFGCTMGEYVRLLRAEFVKRQLSTTNQPLCEIALSAGFSDQSHLNKTFKNLFGITPKQYRRTYRQS
jgi:AraC family transcriptional regulator